MTGYVLSADMNCKMFNIKLISTFSEAQREESISLEIIIIKDKINIF